jgi:hypothetical protein
MRALMDAELLEAAEACGGRHHIDAAVLLACLADPGLDIAAAPELSLGRRDRLLLELRAATFGQRFDLAAPCPACGELLAVGVTAEALRIDGALAHDNGRERPEVVLPGGGRVRLRPLNSLDLAAVALLQDPAEARRTLARRCLEASPPPDMPLPADLLDIIASRLAELDPQSDVFVSLKCLACGHQWQAPIDIGLVLAHDIEAAARRLMDDIHDLAGAYHWTEAEILALPRARRRRYLERIRS